MKISLNSPGMEWEELYLTSCFGPDNTATFTPIVWGGT